MPSAVYGSVDPQKSLSGYVHQSWTDVIPPNGVTGHPNLLTDGIDRGVARPFSAAVRIKEPTEAESLPAKTTIISKGTTGGIASQLFKPSLQPTGLSKFATAYEPLWKRSLPKPTTTIRLAPAPPHVPYGYHRDFMPASLAMAPYPHKHCNAPSILVNPAPVQPPTFSGTIEVPEKPEAYLSHFTELLALELASLQRKAFSYRLYAADLFLEKPRTRVTGQFTTSTLGVWTIHVPGIREDAPRIFLGDVLLLRRIYPESMVADETVFEVRVIGSLKRDGKVYVDSDILWTLFNSGVNSTGAYQVEFKVNSQQICLMQDAVKMMSGLMDRPSELWFDDLLSDKKLSRSQSSLAYLFPTSKNTSLTNGSKTVDSAPEERHLGWFDYNLNEQQKKAVTDISKGKHPIPYLLFGPAGTGKTKTLVEAVLQINRSQRKSAILVCAPSNSAADTIAIRLAKSLDGAQMLRLQNPTRTFAEVPEALRDAYCNLQEGQFVLPPWQKLMRYRVVVTTCTDAGLLANARLTNAEILWVQGEMGRLNPTVAPNMRPHWTHLIVDEAGQAMEPETLIPLSVVTLGTEEAAITAETYSPTIVLCGDIKQLPAIVSCDNARKRGLDISLLERLMGRPVYHQESNHIISLEINYRSHSGILWLPNTLFYNNRLQPCGDIPLSRWRSLPNPQIPIIVKNVGDSNADDWVEEGASWYNRTEVKECRQIVESVLAGPDKYRQTEIAVVTPWRENVLHLRNEFRQAGLWDVNIGNVEGVAHVYNLVYSYIGSDDLGLDPEDGGISNLE
ncbi:hypothetical protein QFC21_000282 [Naganishia friedmannii]|uniref:Uncharacterized protein n=1 Tax=Naganishia friedmannii TaxID=89922 RepID=A0ACC2WCR0_9TREE|nr:hypothetical protein QFC21_000282 [Naganishia friedmannii]